MSDNKKVLLMGFGRAAMYIAEGYEEKFPGTKFDTYMDEDDLDRDDYNIIVFDTGDFGGLTSNFNRIQTVFALIRDKHPEAKILVRSRQDLEEIGIKDIAAVHIGSIDTDKDKDEGYNGFINKVPNALAAEGLELNA